MDAEIWDGGSSGDDDSQDENDIAVTDDDTINQARNFQLLGHHPWNCSLSHKVSRHKLPSILERVDLPWF
jgi:hypothetical protein